DDKRDSFYEHVNGIGEKPLRLNPADRAHPFGRRSDQLSRSGIEKTERNGRRGGSLPVLILHDVLKHSDPALVGFHARLDGAGFAEENFALVTDLRFKDHRAEAALFYGVEPVAVARNEVPARLFKKLQISGVVDVAERVEVGFADQDFV